VEKCKKNMVVALVLLLLFLAMDSGTTRAATAANEQVVGEPTAEQILLVATTYLKNRQQFSFEAEITEDDIFEGNQLIQTNHSMSYFVKRPDKLRFTMAGDFRDREWSYDGKTISTYDRRKGYYSQAKFPPTIDSALVKAETELNLRLSIAGIARDDFFAVLMKGVDKASVVGMSKVEGVPCYQLLLEREWANVQLWVQAGELPLFRKVVVTYKKEDGTPQWSAVLAKWNTSADLSDQLFKFTPPAGAVKIEFLKQVVAGSSDQ
jgi:hypothetical protein